MEQWINTIFDILKIIVIPLCCYIYKDLKDSIKKNNEEVKACINVNNESIVNLRKEIANEFSKQDLKIEKLEEDYRAFKENAPMVYTLREDFLRVMTNVDTKIADMSIKMDKLLEKITNTK